ncbi:aminopeptidase [Flavobacteriaceae bacterium F08102]|nr:aminopeptidase [Flavobacteriaceae bacterium F08102]
MKNRRYILVGWLCLSASWIHAQEDSIDIQVQLNYKSKTLNINQVVTFKNRSSQALDTLYFHAWAEGYRDNSTPLSKRLIEDYDKRLYLAKKEDRGYVQIDSILIKNETYSYFSKPAAKDIIGIVLNSPLEPGQTLNIRFRYFVKVPHLKFTGYGRDQFVYNLRYWYIVPAVYNDGWQLMSNKNMDDLYTRPTTYKIRLIVPDGINVNSDLTLSKIVNPPYSIYELSGEHRSDIELNINAFNDYTTFPTHPKVITNLNQTGLNNDLKTDILNRALAFIKTELGAYPFEKILVSETIYDKNPIYGLNQLPELFNPFSGAFEWDIKMFKALTRKYLENTLFVNRRTDAWLLDGIQSYLMMQYVSQYYPEITAMGNISKIWGIKSFTIAKLGFNDKYAFVYQFAARRNYDQPLTMQADSLSNFNRKIVNKYKAGLGLQYLDEYLNEQIIPQSIREFYKKSRYQNTSSNLFKSIVNSATDKDLSWFFGDYLTTKKKIDYTIKKVVKTQDSVKVTIKNNRDFAAPIAIYGVKKNDYVFRKWIAPIDSSATITLPKGDYTKLALNYEFLYPELNHRDNWENLKGVFNRPIQFRFFKDVEDPYYNQVFYNIYNGYNYYDGLILGPRLYNEAIFKKKWLYKITPTYGFKSNQLSGSASFVYQHIPEKSSVYRITTGISGNSFHYARDLRYSRITPFVNIEFKRKSLRDVGGKGISARYIAVNRETPEDQQALESDRYGIFNLRYGYSKPEIISDIRYNIDLQTAQKFGKIAVDFRYRTLTKSRRQLDFRAYAGSFLYNSTDTDYFNFGLDRPTDYLFDYGYLGRSESSGFLSQQIIIAEGGFKSKFENPYANRWMLASNGSVSLWRWLELYADVGLYKNKGFDPEFRYDSGIRLNFVHNILELYFPLQSSLGFEPSLPNYSDKIRFVLTLDPGSIIRFLRRGFF